MDELRRGERRTSTNTPVAGERIEPRPGAYGDVLRTPTATSAAEGTRPRERVTGEREEAPRLQPAVLGRLEGVGIVTVVRGNDGALVDAPGSWRPADDTASLEDLRTTFPAGSVTTYTGPLVEHRGDGGQQDVRVQVEITRHGEYDDTDGHVVRLVNFVARDLA